MRIVRYLDAVTNETRYGHLAPRDSGGAVLELDGDPFGPHLPTSRPAQVAKRLAPVAPVSILCIGLNYRKHAEETGAKIPQFPMLFMKQPAAIQHPGDAIELPPSSTEVDYEGELVVVIGRQAKNIRPRDAHHHILGYTIGNDVSARDWQKQWGGGQYCRGKGFDTFAPLGPCLVTTDELPDPAALHLTTRLNGQVVQESPTNDMIFGIPALVAFLSQSTTLLPGTAIFTGTPHGVGAARNPPLFLMPGDTIEVEISGIGRLSNPVVMGT